MKTRFTSLRLSNTWVYYLLVVVVAIIFWALAFRVAHVPTNSEQVTIFFAGEVKDYSLASKIKEDCDIRHVEISSSKVDSNEFMTKYQVVGLNNSHLLIIPSDIATKTACVECFVALDEMGIKSDDAFYQEGVAYGLPIDSRLLDDYLNLDGTYYLFVGGLATDSEDRVYDNTQKVIDYLIGGSSSDA